MDATQNLIAEIERVVMRIEGVPDGVQFEPRRYATGSSDLGLLFPVRNWEHTAWGCAVLEALAADPRVESTSLKGQRLSLRFRTTTVAELARAIVAGELGSLTPAPTHKRAVVDFCDPNATKALHVGHLRNIALGHALSSLLRVQGWQVTRQSVVNDVGSSVFEALAGHATFFPNQTPQSRQLKPDRFVGECYRKYVCSLPEPETDVAAPDAPIARELTVRENLAQRMLRQFCDGDHATRQHWAQLVAWVDEGHTATLARLGIQLDVQLLESASMRSCDALVSAGLASGLFSRSEDGIVVYETGEEGYPRVPLVRVDGFPTEHLRALCIWYELDAANSAVERWVHVMGAEWAPSTVHRDAIVRRLGGGQLFDNYEPVLYDMVNIDGTKMKSGAGPVVLLDDLFEATLGSEVVQALSTRAVLSDLELTRVIVLGFFLSKPLHKELEFSAPDLLDPKRNVALALIEAYVTQLSDGPAHDASSDAALRYALMQAQRLERCMRQALTEANPGLVLRALQHLIETCGQRCDALTAELVRATLRFGLQSIGVLAPASQVAQAEPTLRTWAAHAATLHLQL